MISLKVRISFFQKKNTYNQIDYIDDDVLIDVKEGIGIGSPLDNGMNHQIARFIFIETLRPHS